LRIFLKEITYFFNMKLEKLLEDFSEDELDKIIDKVGSYTTEDPEDENRWDKIVLINIADELEILNVIEKIRDEKS